MSHIVKLTQFIIALGGEAVFPALLLTMVVAILLGMGLPTSAAYVLAVAVVGPALIGLGFPPLSAHLFVFYFAIISLITPPICPGCYAASAIALAPWLKIAWISLRLAAVVYIVPFIWMFKPELLMTGSPAAIVSTTLLTLLGALCIATGLVGYLTSRLNPLSRFLFIAAGFMFMLPELIWSLYGAIALTMAFASQMGMPRLVSPIINKVKGKR